MDIQLLGCCDTCPTSQGGACDLVFEITVTWPATFNDLDVGVKYNSATAGFDCTNGANPLHDSGDVTSSGGSEKFFVNVTPGVAGFIDLFFHWHLGANNNKDGDGTSNVNRGSANIAIEASTCDSTSTLTVNTLSEYSGCSCDVATHKKARIAIGTTGLWVLETA